MTAVEKRFLTGFRSADADTPGLIQEDDGTVWLVAPDGSRTQISGGGSSPLVASVTLTNAQIRALPVTPIQVVAPTETPNYVGSVSELPIPIMAAFACDFTAAAYTNVGAASQLGIYFDSFADVLATVPDNTSLMTTAGQQILVSSPRFAVAADTAGPWDFTDVGSGGLHDNGLYVGALNSGMGAFTAGDAANEMVVTVTYVVVQTGW